MITKLAKWILGFCGCHHVIRDCHNVYERWGINHATRGKRNAKDTGGG